MPRLFNKFSQAETSTARDYGGSGLGLAICRELTRLMHGRIGADSQTGQGSIFWFEIPFHRNTPDTVPMLTEISTEQGTEQGFIRGRNGHILVVEDNSINRWLSEARVSG